MRNLGFASRTVLPQTLAALAIVSLGGCLPTAFGPPPSKDPPNAYDAIRSADLQPRFPEATQNANTGEPEPKGASYYGSPVEALVSAAPEHDGEGGFTLNFEDTPVATVAKVVLGDILNTGYSIDPRAQGTISLSSGRPIAKSDMLFVLENALRVNNLLLVRDAVGYRILPATDGAIGSIDRPGPGGAAEPGYGLTVIPVQYVSGETLVKLMEGFESKPGTIRTDPSGKILLVLGTGSERQTALETVRTFDVDWLRGQSVGIYPVYNGASATLVTELEKIMDSGETGLSHNLVKFQAVDRQNSILVVASKPQLLRMASTWISRLDKSSVASTGVKVYRVKYGDAKQMATLLANMFTGSGSTGLEAPANQIAPNAGATTLSTVDRLTGGLRQETPSANAPPTAAQSAEAAAAISTAGTLGPLGAGGGGGGGAGGAPLPNVRITADVANNSILVYASQEDYRIIERALNQLDRPKLQVAIDVTIAEVTLNDQLDYGVQFFLNKGSVLNVSQTSLPITPTLPGFNVVLGNALSPRVVINALHQYTDVKILSNPSLVVVDNQPATLEVGDQVPITTGSATVLSANNAVVNTVDYKNTGIILKVQPRVNSNGTVLLDIEQEISAVVSDLTSGGAATSTTNLTPTISERRVKSELSVANGQTVLLAGLISETQSVAHTGIPILDRIPVVGDAFGSKNNAIVRTELILFIRPQIIHDGADASVVAEELRSKMRGGQLGSLGLPKLLPEPHRTLQ
ncbi:type II secretion system protein D (GspD) [Roseiarcus fermentans]|uniref:Type II secretion system protein D (GspD) n=1 Tax=Roseiarcus fermentans TaxID=1473586 RepID=A0A366EQJ0_9HYPH|nr:type II secretion system secretin GspD [Roseiarcus fermentans]RBP04658.1 type II secretion system protein D (GspD) [Roseiarcus fermentans]